jgi:MFS family permease
MSDATKPVGQDAHQPKTWHCGTLTYTKPALVVLFFWLFWGDICYTLMEGVCGPIMQFKFEDLGASNKTYVLVANTIPGLVYIFMNPVISFKSDRYRSRWGRRVPFVIFTLPFLTLGLVALAYCDWIGAWVFRHLNGSWVYRWAMGSWVHRHVIMTGVSPRAVAIGIVVAVLAGFLFFLRVRSRWGWRIPYLAIAAPFLLIAGVVLYYRGGITGWINGCIQAAEFSPTTVLIATIGVLLVTFTFVNTIFTSMFWYLFRDVVPEALLARFMSWFRLIAMVSGAMYQWFVFGYSRTKATEIFLGAAAVYLVGFSLMMLNVREGKYPPPSPYADGQKGPLAAIKTYGKECHSHAHYWYFWLLTFVGSIGGGAAAFNIYFLERIGLVEVQIGRINAISSVVVAILVLGAGWLADRFHPIRVVIAASLLGLLVTPVNLIWLFWHPPAAALWTWHAAWLGLIPTLHIQHWHLYWGHLAPLIQVRQVYLVQIVIAIGLGAPVAALASMWDPVLLMRVFPHERMGQFCSTNGIWRAGGGLLGGFLAGAALDFIGLWVGKSHEYFYIPIWQMAFSIPAFILLLKFYQSWKKYGGDENYVPPSLDPVAQPEPVPVPNPATV